MDAYHAFAAVYDKMMEDIPYKEWFDYVCNLFDEYSVNSGLMLELGCGTGTLTEMFAKKGFDMIGIDNSPDMLEQAMEKRAVSGLPILYLDQDIREFELYGTVRGIYSLCDTMNYITEYDDLVTVLKLANNYLDPGGIFIFDLKTDSYYRNDVGNQSFCDADEELCYIWENAYDEDEHINEYSLTLFLHEDDNIYQRFDEYHVQRAYSETEIKQAAAESGMEYICALDGSHHAADSSSKRIYIILREHGKDVV